ncbi:hypothetical protein NDU88_000418 [Pleurodeles waltl]|uniref:Uncharacterized protein n=1 Tax=Pleurodeles waltl TaxID=8319 RepID=A0AAV7S4H7_PLEWA|nr:hypothetical protein NDU88_000418 [Pleurodeles waltl]
MASSMLEAGNSPRLWLRLPALCGVSVRGRVGTNVGQEARLPSVTDRYTVYQGETDWGICGTRTSRSTFSALLASACDAHQCGGEGSWGRERSLSVSSRYVRVKFTAGQCLLGLLVWAPGRTERKRLPRITVCSAAHIGKPGLEVSSPDTAAHNGPRFFPGPM